MYVTALFVSQVIHLMVDSRGPEFYDNSPSHRPWVNTRTCTSAETPNWLWAVTMLLPGKQREYYTGLILPSSCKAENLTEQAGIMSLSSFYPQKKLEKKNVLILKS